MTENEEKKNWLLKYKHTKARAIELQEELETLKQGKISPSSVIAGMPSSGGSDMSSYVAAVETLQEKILQKRYEAIKTYTAISDAIEALDDDMEKRIMRLRYLKLMRWEDVITKIGYAEKQTYRIHGQALDKIKIPKK